MARVTFNLNEEKEKEGKLLEFLNAKIDRAAYIKEILFETMIESEGNKKEVEGA